MKRNLYLTMLIVLIQVVSAFAQENWKLQRDKDGIQVYSAEVPDSKIRAIKVVADYDTSPGEIADIVMDINTAKEWVSHLKSSYLIKQVSQNELYYYAEVNLPWPVANRDFVAHLTRYENIQTGTITIDGPAVAGFMPEKKGIVRINNSTGKWVITPLENNHVRVEYSLHVDPAGSIPSWLVNMFSGETPMQIFENLRQQIKPVVQTRATAMINNEGTK
ncbi:START domain-containing protein [Mucilaginibacter sp. X4EP1]|uniref:START domain-containing protein n=1 Tax=Mucilaginibacter sp. X4EP1 TaxID=2723092 RepID=UPI002169C6B3|nr:START domain-containing protein [Mucilaginibacter sp. X4EP1]MCS3812007.1 ribosome-associated toxin RatA of RatAB toxin-antitoxin module [Mucilaginibacter sp. X4EP1]